MSLIDQLLSQQIVLISVGVFFLFIVAAISVAVYPRIKASRAKAAKRKAADKAAKEAAQEEAKTAKEAARAARKGGRQAAAAEAAAPAAPPTATGSVVVIPGALPAAPAGTPTAGAPAVPAPAAAPKPAVPTAPAAPALPTEKDEVTPEMQDLLSSVFSDEENTERQAILLKGSEAVSIEELLILSKAVMAQINGEQQDNIVRVKENQLS